jgi:prepilin-type N-terminal cleavage/methylation domain-containing protein
MIRKLNTSKAGFTLVEIMIVVAIIALLATIAVPSFLRARKRSQATKIVNDARIYEAAIDQWAIENNKSNDNTFAFSNVSDYIKASTELVRTSGYDILSNLYFVSTVAAGVKVNNASYTQLSDVTRPDFWSSYAP